MSNHSWILLIGLLSSMSIRSQEFGGNPPSLKWKQVNTQHARVIFPDGMDRQASRVAEVAAFLQRTTTSSLGDRTRKVDIVLQNQTTISNGYVQLGPWRSEFFLTPLQNGLRLGSISWVDQLAVHEYRHVQQYMNFRKGLSKFAYLVAGEQGQAIANNAAIPNWFFEGDAVYQESVVTGQGRGRLPSFFAEFRSLWESGRNYSYMKLRNGSLKHQVPDHYVLGYMLVNHGYQRYGNDFWRKVTDDAARFKPLFYPFQGAVRQHSGSDFDGFVRDALSFHANRSGKPDSTLLPITAVSERYVKDHSFPYPLGDDTILVTRRTGRHIPGFYLLSGHQEKRIAVRDIGIDDQYAYRNGKMYYTAYKPDPRWGWRIYSDIIRMDARTGKRERITHKGKYFSPDVSPDGERIAAVEVLPSGVSSLHIIRAGSGIVTARYSDSALFLSQPRFLDNGDVIILARALNGNMSILRLDSTASSPQPLFPFSAHVISFPFVKGSEIWFTAVQKGQDRLMVWDMDHRTMTEVKGRYAGVMQGVPLGSDSTILAGVTAWGNRIFRDERVSVPIEIAEWTKPDTDMYGLRDTSLNIYASLDSAQHSSSPYKGTTRLLNFHSWRPYYEQPEWSFTLYGENVLNTFRSSLYYIYNENERYHQLGYDGSFAAWFPWITGGVSYTMGRRAVENNRELKWNELNGRLGLRLPLDFSGGRMYRFLTLSSTYNLQQLYFRDLPKQEDINFSYLDNFMSWNSQIQQATQHIYPRFAYTLQARYRASISSVEARQLLLSGSVYLPGFMRTHNLVINAAYQSRDTMNQYVFSNSFPLSRGYPAVNFPRMWKWGVNYHLPFCYPDWGFANLVYFLRIRGNIFYDHSGVKSLRTGRTTYLASTGLEVFFDTRWWNQQNVSFGIRYSRLLDNDLFTNPPNANQFEFVLPLNLIPR